MLVLETLAIKDRQKLETIRKKLLGIDHDQIISWIDRLRAAGFVHCAIQLTEFVARQTKQSGISFDSAFRQLFQDLCLESAAAGYISNFNRGQILDIFLPFETPTGVSDSAYLGLTSDCHLRFLQNWGHGLDVYDFRVLSTVENIDSSHFIKDTISSFAKSESNFFVFKKLMSTKLTKDLEVIFEFFSRLNKVGCGTLCCLSELLGQILISRKSRTFPLHLNSRWKRVLIEAPGWFCSYYSAKLLAGSTNNHDVVLYLLSDALTHAPSYAKSKV